MPDWLVAPIAFLVGIVALASGYALIGLGLLALAAIFFFVTRERALSLVGLLVAMGCVLVYYAL